MLQSGYGKTDEQCREALEQIPIVHVHGRLGFLPWQKDCDPRRRYEPTTDPGVLISAAASIKIVHEDIDDSQDKDFRFAKNLMRNAEQIYFLGFGYAPTNIQRLEVLGLPDGRAAGTGHGLTSHERHQLSGAMSGKIALYDHDCLDFLRNLAVWT